MKSKKTLGIFAGISTLVALTVTFISANAKTTLSKDNAGTQNYTLTLDSTNAYSSGTSQSVLTDSGNYQVTFNYSSCSAKNNYHAAIADGGTIVNADHIRSINEFTAVYDGGTLKAKTSFDGKTWGEYFALTSNFTYSFSDVYYVSLLAVDTVNLQSALFNYSCVVNAEAHEGEQGGSGYYEKVTSALTDYSGKYLIVCETGKYALDGSLSTLDAVSNYIDVTIINKHIASNTTTDASAFTVAKSGTSYTIKSASGYYIGRDGNSNGLSSSTTNAFLNTVSYNDITGSAGAHLRFNISDSRFRYFKSTTYTAQAEIALYKLSEGAIIDTPKDEVGFTATDSNKDSYSDTSVFDTANGLSAVVHYSDGTQENLANTAYSYKIYNSSSEEIDTSVAFGTAGTYTLRVSYKNFIPQDIVLNVGEYIYLTGITATMSDTEFTTDEKLSDNLASNIIANKTYSNSSSNVSNIAYSNFSTNNLSVTLYNPSNVATSISNKFATAGAWKVKVTCSEDANISATIDITVTAISVTSVTLSQSELALKTGKSATLTATVLPTNATDGSVTWSSNAPTIASVTSAGVVTGVAAGSATITATANDGSGAYGTCAVTVTKSTTTTATITVNGSFSGTNPISLTTSNFITESITLTDVDATNIYAGTKDNEIKFSSSKKSGSLVLSFESTLITNVKLIASQYNSENASITVKTSANTTGQTKSLGSETELSFDAFANDSNESTSLTISSPVEKRFYLTGIELTIGAAEPVYPTAISLSGSSSVGQGKTTKLSVAYTPSNTNQKNATFESSDTSVATVTNAGIVTGVATGNATITASALKADDSYATAEFNITVTEVAPDAWTILIYMCGSDLESGYDSENNEYNYLASSDLTEIASVYGQPDDVNIVVEAGGSSRWNPIYSSVISTSYLNRFHLENKSYVKDEQITKANMGKSSTFQSFLEWGLTEYPAQKTGVILWNHGGGMYGACYDENYDDDSLTHDEAVTAIEAAYEATGTTKLEWIGYDCCLMQTQEVAEFNSPYFNYMIASEESEAGYGWDYDTWVDDLYDYDDTETILTTICDGFITDNGGVNGTGGYYQGEYYPCDQTLSFLNLNYMSAYKTAWENMSAQLKNKITSNNASSFRSNVIGKTKYFAGSDYRGYGQYDVYHFLSILENNSTFNPGSSYISAVRTAFANLVVYNTAQAEAAHDAYGLCFYFHSSTSYYNKATSTYSNFTNWNYINANYGGNVSSSYSY